MSYGKDTFVLSLGGSLIATKNGIDIQFLTDFNKFIRNQITVKKRRFFITVGGGATAGQYIDASKKVSGVELTDDDFDWLGIHCTRLNAQLVRTIFRDIAHSHVLKHYEIIRKADEQVVIAAGWKPGFSTDYCAITLCQDYGIKMVINMTNIDKVYTKDPNKFADAKPIDTISWKNYRAIAGDTWSPRMNLPFDPIASKLAQENGITVKILNGKNLVELAKALDNKPFGGSVIS
jgi:uridylate kinase